MPVKARRDLSREVLMEILSYDPETGIFRWVKPLHKRLIGQIAGREQRGYRRINVSGKMLACHRLAWLFIHGAWPDCEVDHINMVRGDNRIANLRLASRSDNLANRNVRPVCASGVKGVFPKRGKWGSRIHVRGQTIYLGSFPTKEAAASAFQAAEIRYRGEFSRSLDRAALSPETDGGHDGQ